MKNADDKLKFIWNEKRKMKKQEKNANVLQFKLRFFRLKKSFHVQFMVQLTWWLQQSPK